MKTMKKHISHIITLAAITGLLVIAGNATQAQTTTDTLLADSVDQSAFPQITVQPVDQTVPIGSSVTLSVQANNADSYQWLINGVPADGQTNTLFTIASAGIGDVGLYSCNVSLTGGGTVPTRAANVCVYITGSSAATPNVSAAAIGSSSVAAKSSAVAASSGVMQASMPGGGPITVYGTPLAGNGSSGGCPGKYAGYVIYSKPVSQGWGWSPSGTVHTVTDTNRSDTKVQYFGLYGDNGCNQTTVSIPNPAYSPVYQFAIYFPNNVPTNAYPMVLLTGFNP